MRGRKLDPDFFLAFIQECTNLGLSTSDQFVERAKQIAQQIAREVQEIEHKKIIRGKLLAVIDALKSV